MTVLDHITAGRTVLRALLIAVVVTAGIAGVAGTVAAEPMDGKGDDPFPPSLTLGSWTDVIDGTGNDVLSVGFSSEAGDDDYVGRGGGSGKASL